MERRGQRRRKWGGKGIMAGKTIPSGVAEANGTGSKASPTLLPERCPGSCNYQCMVVSVVAMMFFSFSKLAGFEAPVMPSSRDVWAPLSTLPTDNAVTELSSPKVSPCEGYRGVLHIAQGDAEGAAGTIFFLFVVNQLLYAERQELIPWVHLNKVSRHVYDPTVHGPPDHFNSTSNGNPKSFKRLRATPEVLEDPRNPRPLRCPGSPVEVRSNEAGEPPISPMQAAREGNGVWASYFEPVSGFTPSDPVCARLPVLRLEPAQILPGLHLHCPWAVRAWKYGGLPPSNREGAYEGWLAAMRRRGGRVVTEKVRFLPHIRALAQEANPMVPLPGTATPKGDCLGLHVRHSDKANRRKILPLERFLPYARAYMEERGDDAHVYIATDSAVVIREIQGKKWGDIALHWQKEAFRSENTTAVFRLASDRHHETNTQVLVDILALSHCRFLVHGLSAVSEAAHYLAESHHPSGGKEHPWMFGVNLETPNTPMIESFRAWVRENPP